jgi:hypothetical protein
MATSYFQERGPSPSIHTGGAASSPRSPLTPSAAAPRSNALQNRITSVLSASYADLEIRDALGAYDERKLTNTAEARRNLRLDVQEELIQCNGEIVQDFGQVALQLKRIGAAISSLNDSCAEMRKHIAAANRETGPMLDEAKVILDGKKEVESKKQLLDAFKAHFVLSEEDQATLTSTTEPVNDDFFRILTRVKKIHQDSHILLGSENQRLGLEILEQSSKNVNAAYQKLYRWVQREFKSLDLENPQISTAIRRGLRVLAERPTLFQNCLDFFAEARENVLSNNFYAALTGAPIDPDHPVMGKAIELSAHDPLRYVGDMLAWAHSATVSEREALEVLFIADGDEIAKSIALGIESEPWTRAGDAEDAPVFDGKRSLNQLVDRDLAGVFRQLKQRVEQVVQSHQDATLAYRISNLLTFYTSIFSSLLSPSSALLATLSPLAENALRAFKTCTRDHLASLQTSAHPISPSDLAPPDFLTDALATLTTLMTSFSTSTTPASTDKDQEGTFTPILQEALHPYLAGCTSLARTLQAPHAQIFLLNTKLATLATLQPFQTFTSSQIATLRTEIAAHTTALQDATAAFLLSASGLKPLLDVHDFRHASGEEAKLNLLATCAQKLDSFLPSATEDARAFLGQLQEPGIVRGVVEEAAERFCETFEEIEGRVLAGDEDVGDVDEDSDVVLLREIFPRTAGEIRVLLS